MAEARLAIVTGGGRGIGRAICFALAQQGRRVVALDISDENLHETQQQASTQGWEILVEKLDITDTPAYTALIEKLAEAHGGVGVLVNNAGITRDALLVAMDDAQFDRVIEINLRAAFVGMRAAARSMMRNRFGRIVSIASVSGVIGNAGQANYSASKAGLIGMTKTVARELGKRNITANCVAPGFIVSDMTDVLPDKVKEAARDMIPMKRFGAIEDVARAVAFLAGDDAGYITGQVLCVDGGMAM